LGKKDYYDINFNATTVNEMLNIHEKLPLMYAEEENSSDEVSVE